MSIQRHVDTTGVHTDLQGGDAAALVGGIALLTVFAAAAFARNRTSFMETSAEHIVDGLVFAFKAMAWSCRSPGSSSSATRSSRARS